MTDGQRSSRLVTAHISPLHRRADQISRRTGLSGNCISTKCDVSQHIGWDTRLQQQATSAIVALICDTIFFYNSFANKQARPRYVGQGLQEPFGEPTITYSRAREGGESSCPPNSSKVKILQVPGQTVGAIRHYYPPPCNNENINLILLREATTVEPPILRDSRPELTARLGKTP